MKLLHTLIQPIQLLMWPLISALTRPEKPFYKLKQDNTLWVSAQPKYHFNEINPLIVWTYQRVYQTKWGKWEYSTDTIMIEKPYQQIQRDQMFYLMEIK